MDTSINLPMALSQSAAQMTLADFFEDQVALQPQAIAIQTAQVNWTFAELDMKVNQLCNWLRLRGVVPGERIAILSENCPHYVQTLLAAAKLGAIVACLNWRQTSEELAHCIGLVKPKLALISDRYAHHTQLFDQTEILMMGEVMESALATSSTATPHRVVQPEDGLYILYTSGTTGNPKAALISHRALLARCTMAAIDGGFRRGATFVCWPPMFHMVSADQVLMALAGGGKIVMLDGFQLDELCDAVEQETNLGWFVLMPGMIDKVLEELKRRGSEPQPMDSVGCMADLVPRHQIAEVTRLFNAPFRNSFGSTEAGPAPGGGRGGRIAVGLVPQDLGKSQSSMTRVRLIDEEGCDVAPGQPGELLLRSASLFSGYWGMPEATSEAFEGGWFHTGDVFVRQGDNTLQFVDRRKYLIKSGGENIYPAEIEQLLLASSRIVDAAVVRKSDPKWGEVPVAFVATEDVSLTVADVIALCQGRIAGYKMPREVRFIRYQDMPRSTTGKVMRNQLEDLLKKEAN